MNIRNATRLAILSLLMSLVLSSGEGIRLFPIPVISESGSEAHSQTVTSSGATRYQYAARRFGSLLKYGGSSAAKSKNDTRALAGPAAPAELEPSFPASIPSSSFEWFGLDDRDGVRGRSRSRGPPSC